jgi:hypothetical protein
MSKTWCNSSTGDRVTCPAALAVKPPASMFRKSDAVSERIDSSSREKPLGFKELELVRIEKTDQLFLNMLYAFMVLVRYFLRPFASLSHSDLLMIPPSPGDLSGRDAASAGCKYDSFAKIRRSGHIWSQMPNPGDERMRQCKAMRRRRTKF